MRNRRRHQARAFTLIETAIALAIAAILLSGLSAAMVVASRAIPTTSEIGTRDRIVIDTMNELRTRMRHAQSVKLARTTGEIQIVITFKASGVVGAPAQAVYTFSSDTKSLDIEIDSVLTENVITGITAIDGTVSYESTTMHALRLRLKIDGTIQGQFEFTLSLPNAPDIG